MSQRYSELYLNTSSKLLHWLSKKCRRQDLNSQPQQPLPDLIPSLMLQTARFYARLYYHMQTWAHNLLRQKVITDWVSAIVSYILTRVMKWCAMSTDWINLCYKALINSDSSVRITVSSTWQCTTESFLYYMLMTMSLLHISWLQDIIIISHRANILCVKDITQRQTSDSF